jgi:hypothetical protein
MRAFIRDSGLSSALWRQVRTSAAVGAWDRAGPAAVQLRTLDATARRSP